MKKLHYIFLLTFCILGMGCEKILEKDPVDQISIESTFRDVDGAKAALLGAYNSLFSVEYFNGRRSIYPELTGGNVKYSNFSRVTLQSEYNFAATAAETEMASTYSAMYAILNNLNYIIQKVPAITAATTSENNRLLGEARALRALIHFDLLQLYGQAYNYTQDASHPGVVINLTPIYVNNQVIKRSTVKEGYNAVLNDLTTAASLIANSKALFTAGSTANYINANSINALMARVYLSMGNWQQAYNSADKVIATNAYTLFTNGNYAASWLLKNPAESIFEISVPNNFAGNSYGSYFVGGGDYQQMATTEDLLDLYSNTDVRGRNNLFSTSVVNGITYYFTKKYPTQAASATGFKVIRLSEMYLIRAEAAAELGNTTQANSDLNLIRKRGDTAAATLTLSTTSQLVTSIMLERRKELSLEGFLLFDLARRKINVVRNDCISNNCNLNYPNAHYVLPIPEQSVRSNANMVQNPEY